ncbi:MAG: sugar transferase [Paracoccaceae bacterium]|nr:sugar transferase [Paracoccaceae bacterium]
MAERPGQVVSAVSGGRRGFDLALAALLALLLWPLAALIALAILLADGRPVLFGSERIGKGGRPFTLWKFRSMVPGSDDGVATGGEKAVRITRLGRFLRRARLDELPQLWNVLSGEMAFVGPRPPLRRYVDRFPALYGEVLRERPGITGAASLIYHRREEELLAGCITAEESDSIYTRRCVPAKARLDLRYRRRRSPCSDLGLLWTTVSRVLLRRRLG